MMYDLLKQLLMNIPGVEILIEICYFSINFFNDFILIRNLFHHINLFSLDGQSVREMWTPFFCLCPQLSGRML